MATIDHGGKRWIVTSRIETRDYAVRGLHILAGGYAALGIVAVYHCRSPILRRARVLYEMEDGRIVDAIEACQSREMSK